MLYEDTYSSAANPDPFFQVQPNFGPKCLVQTGLVGLQDPKLGSKGQVDL